MVSLELKNPSSFMFKIFVLGDIVGETEVTSATIKTHINGPFGPCGFDLIISYHKENGEKDVFYDWSGSVRGCKQIFASYCKKGAKWLKKNEMNRHECRELFKAKGLDYSMVTKQDIDRLIFMLKVELESFKNIDFTMKVRAVRKMDKLWKKGRLVKYSIFVSGFNPHKLWDRREAITFNPPGLADGSKEFIGFAGWADDKNVQPFLNAFKKWVGSFSLIHEDKDGINYSKTTGEETSLFKDKSEL